jgi:hypothetical protein
LNHLFSLTGTECRESDPVLRLLRNLCDLRVKRFFSRRAAKPQRKLGLFCAPETHSPPSSVPVFLSPTFVASDHSVHSVEGLLRGSGSKYLPLITYPLPPRDAPASLIDNLSSTALFSAVRVFRNIAFFMLAALWLPLTLHCRLEAAGFLIEAESHHKAQDCCTQSPVSDCAKDACPLLERATYRTSDTAVSLPAPAFLACVIDVCIHLLNPVDASGSGSVSTAPTSFDRPHDCSPIWHFVQRAAPPARAPSVELA